MKFPEKVKLIEVGPRDGFQFEKTIIPTDVKVRVIKKLVDAGLTQIQVTSFVHPKRVPQMADAEALVKQLPRLTDVEYTALVLNAKGVKRAAEAGISTVEISVSASDAHSSKNTGMPVKEAVTEAKLMIDSAMEYGLRMIFSVQCAFGCVYEGSDPLNRIEGILREVSETWDDHRIDRISLADTTGMANPVVIAFLLKRLSPFRDRFPLGMHFHDTRGLGLVNVYFALSQGIDRFDTSIGGMGGCPFLEHAAGNIVTEDTLYLMESLGIETGIDMKKLVCCTKEVSGFLGKTFPGKMQHVISILC